MGKQVIWNSGATLNVDLIVFLRNSGRHWATQSQSHQLRVVKRKQSPAVRTSSGKMAAEPSPGAGSLGPIRELWQGTAPLKPGSCEMKIITGL